MSKERCQELVGIGDRLFSNRSSLVSLWQDIAEHFCPERADFTSSHSLGADFASHLMSGFPALQLRELADQLAAMLRPREKLWARLSASEDRINEDSSAKQWLEWASERQRRATYAGKAQFLRATKAGDTDFVSFGQTVLLPSMNPTLDGLLFRWFHLRDVVWCENLVGEIDAVHRKEKMCARDMVRHFPKTVSQIVKNIADKEPYREFECRHIVIPADQYDIGKSDDEKKPRNGEKYPFYSVYLDKENDTILEEIPQRRVGYVIPRWKLGAFKQYATSPATMLAMPDARLMQTMILSLLQATEKAAEPPMVATQEAVRSDMHLFAGGVTWVDREYDERLGDALRPITQDLRGLQYAMEMVKDVRELIKHTFYLNKINLPEVGKDMTAYETRKRIEEYVRAALPLFEPMEVEYNGALCNETFNIMLDNNGFGAPETMPEVLRGADVRFEFESPLQATAKRANAQAFQEMAGITAAAIQLDPKLRHNLNAQQAYRDALEGVEVPADWIVDPKVVEQMVAAEQAAMAKQQQAAQIGQIAEVANKAAPMVSALNR